MTLKIADLDKKRDRFRRWFYFKKKGGAQVCGSAMRKKDKGERCGQTIDLGENGRCYLHGKDAGAPVVNGRWSIRNKALQDLFLRLRSRPDILDLRDGIAAFDVRIEHLWESLKDEGDSPVFRQRLRELATAAIDSLKGTESKDVLRCVRDIAQHAAEGATELDKWTDLLDLIERRNKRAEAALLSSVRGQNAVPARDVVVFLARIADIIVMRCRGHSELSEQILTDIGRFIGKAPAIPVDPEVVHKRE